MKTPAQPPYRRRSLWSVLLLLLALTLGLSTGRAQQTAINGWFATQQQGDLVYFFFSSPAKVERFDLPTRTWLPSITLPAVRGAATAAGVDADSVYIAYDKACYRYSLLGQNERFLLNSDVRVTAFHSDGNILIINRSDSLYARLTSVDKTTNLIVDTAENYIYALGGSSIAPGQNKLFGRSLGVSPSDITYYSYTDTGSFVSGGDSPYHGDYANASRTWVFPNGSRVADDSGTVYSTSNLGYVSALGGALDDISFRGEDIPIVLRGRQLTAYNTGMLPTGSANLTATPTRIFVFGDDVLAFRRDTTAATGLAMESMALSSLSAPLPGEPLNPNGLPFVLNGAWLDKDNHLLLFSKALQSVFRWNTQTQSYGATIPLLDTPDYVTYSPAHHALYTAYNSGLVQKIDLAANPLRELPFAQLPAMPRGLAAAGNTLMVGDASGAWMTHRTFDAAGTQISAVDWNYYSQEYVWSAANGRLYFFRDDTSPNDLLWEIINPDGSIGTKQDSPYHGDFAIQHPIRVARNGSRVIIGSGVAFNALTLEKLASGLSNTFTDGDWGVNDAAFWSVRPLADRTQLQEWNGATLAAGRTKQWPGHASRVFALPDNKLLTLSTNTAPPAAGVLSFHLWDASLNLVAPPTLATPAAPKATALTTTSVTISWPDVTGENGYEVERRLLPDGAWTPLLVLGMSESSVTDSSVSSGNNYEYRVTAVNDTLRSAASPAGLVSMTPAGPPPGLTASRSGSWIVLNWTDVSGETGYTIQRRSGTAGNWSLMSNASANAITQTDFSVSSGVRYYYRIATVNPFGTGPWSDPVSERLPAPAPGIPNWSTPVLGPDNLTLRWSGVNYAEEYQIEWKRPTDTEWTALVTVPSGPSSLSYVHTTLTPTTSYQYRLRSRSEDGTSSWSVVQTYTTTIFPPPATPVLQSVLGGDSGTLTLTWTNVASEQGYIVERMVDTGWAERARTAADVTTFTDTGLANGITVCYRVRAFNTSQSDPSTILCATPGVFVSVAEDNFSTGPLPAWAELAGCRKLDQVGGLLDGAALWFGQAGPRSATTHAFDLTAGATLRFAFRAGNEAVDGATYWNDSEAGEGVQVQWSADGVNWTSIVLFDTMATASKSWGTYSYTLPSAALTPTTRFRWRQTSHTGPNYDTWALDNVSIVTSQPPAPAAPAFLNASPGEVAGLSSVILNWPTSARALLWDLERTDNGTDWEAVATGLSQSFFYDMQVTPGTGYGYRVRARNAGGASLWSPIIFIQSLSAEAAWQLAETGSPVPPPLIGDFDPDPTGLSRILRFAFRLSGQSIHTLDVANPAHGGAPLTRLNPATGKLEIVFLRPVGSAAPDLECTAEFSSDGIRWTPGPAADVLDVIDGVWEMVLCRDPESGPARFGRVRVSRP
jgi:hypothetical protein